MRLWLAAGEARSCGGVAEWLRQGPAKPCTRVRFPSPPPFRPDSAALVSWRHDHEQSPAVARRGPAVTPWHSLNSRLRAPAGVQLTLFEELGGT